MALIPLDNEVKAYHSEKELLEFRKHLVVLDPVDSSQYFPTSAHCRGCHSTDLEGFAMVDNLGNDINMQLFDQVPLAIQAPKSNLPKLFCGIYTMESAHAKTRRSQ